MATVLDLANLVTFVNAQAIQGESEGMLKILFPLQPEVFTFTQLVVKQQKQLIILTLALIDCELNHTDKSNQQSKSILFLDVNPEIFIFPSPVTIAKEDKFIFPENGNEANMDPEVTFLHSLLFITLR